MTLARNGLAVTRPNATLDTPLAAALLVRARHMGDLDSIRANNQIGSLSFARVMQPEDTSASPRTPFFSSIANGIC